MHKELNIRLIKNKHVQKPTHNVYTLNNTFYKIVKFYYGSFTLFFSEVDYYRVWIYPKSKNDLNM